MVGAKATVKTQKHVDHKRVGLGCACPQWTMINKPQQNIGHGRGPDGFRF